MKFIQVLTAAIRSGASDIVLKTNCEPRFRVSNELVALSGAPTITSEVMLSWIKEILPPHLKSKLESMGDVDFAHTSEDGNRFRVNLFRQRQTFAMVLRVINNHIRSIEELQLPEIMQTFPTYRRGLVLVTGATGSGKTTTLASIIDKMNRDYSRHIITIEDPIEFWFKDINSTINQREVGIDTHGFARALRAALRQNPDTILVGELRDKETTETALMAAETGHFVLSTLHTKDAVESLTRLMSYFPPHQNKTLRMTLSQSLVAIASQRLVPRADASGMAVAVEIMICNALIRDTILNGEHFDNIHESIRTGGDTYGMQSFDQSLVNLYSEGVITYETAIDYATSREDMELVLSGIAS